MERTKEMYQRLIEIVMEMQLQNFKDSQAERGQISKADWDRNDGFSVMAEIDWFEESFIGYPVTIASKGMVRNPEEALINLKKANFLENERFAEWYFSKREEYPHLIRRVELLDYLRLLSIEYLSKFPT